MNYFFVFQGSASLPALELIRAGFSDRFEPYQFDRVRDRVIGCADPFYIRFNDGRDPDDFYRSPRGFSNRLIGDVWERGGIVADFRNPDWQAELNKVSDRLHGNRPNYKPRRLPIGSVFSRPVPLP